MSRNKVPLNGESIERFIVIIEYNGKLQKFRSRNLNSLNECTQVIYF